VRTRYNCKRISTRSTPHRIQLYSRFTSYLKTRNEKSKSTRTFPTAYSESALHMNSNYTRLISVSTAVSPSNSSNDTKTKKRHITLDIIITFYSCLSRIQPYLLNPSIPRISSTKTISTSIYSLSYFPSIKQVY
jgi:hypothetical protein